MPRRPREQERVRLTLNEASAVRRALDGDDLDDRGEAALDRALKKMDIAAERFASKRKRRT